MRTFIFLAVVALAVSLVGLLPADAQAWWYGRGPVVSSYYYGPNCYPQSYYYSPPVSYYYSAPAYYYSAPAYYYSAPATSYYSPGGSYYYTPSYGPVYGGRMYSAGPGYIRY